MHNNIKTGNVIITIIVPIYNTKCSYLCECLNSLLTVKDKNIEFILIDDGSTNNDTIEAIKNYENIDSRIKIFRQSNVGVSAARNKGIDMSKGEYIMFVDSDDIIVSENLSMIIKNQLLAKKPDVLLSAYFKQKQGIRKINVKMKKNIIRKLICCRMPSAPWAKIYKRSIIDNGNIRFNSEIAIGEDLLFNYQYFSKCKKILAVDLPVYVYRENIFSAMHTSKRKSDIDKVLRIIDAEYPYPNDVRSRKCYEKIYTKWVDNTIRPKVSDLICLLANCHFSIRMRVKAMIVYVYKSVFKGDYE